MKPYYVIDFSVVNCFMDIRVNEIPVFNMNADGQVATIIPINNAIVESGKQNICYRLLPLLGETVLRDNADFSASVWLYDASGDLIKKQEEINDTLFTMPKNTKEIPLPECKGEIIFNAIVPYKLDAWQNSQDLRKIENLRFMVNSVYRKIEEIINNAHYDKFCDLIKQREDNVAVCMYLSESEKNERITNLIDTIKEHDLKIVPFSENDEMVIFGNNKLVTLQNPDGDSALVLKNEESEMELSLAVSLHLKQDEKELSII